MCRFLPFNNTYTIVNSFHNKLIARTLTHTKHTSLKTKNKTLNVFKIADCMCQLYKRNDLNSV